MSWKRILLLLTAGSFGVHAAGCVADASGSLSGDDEADESGEVATTPDNGAEEIGEARDAAGFGTGGWINININTKEGWFGSANGATCILEVSYHECSTCGYTDKDRFTTTSSGGACRFFGAYSWPYTVTNFIAAGSATYRGRTLLTGKKTGPIAQSGWNAGLISTTFDLTF
ncbi:hypothetical protein [Sorangium sp. So ce1153]|uniref:hypothetical protein n=1 Tax=Sorangium sp. So ce1153 TaxID=3133333 RepID=UPI003F5DB200